MRLTHIPVVITSCFVIQVAAMVLHDHPKLEVAPTRNSSALQQMEVLIEEAEKLAQDNPVKDTTPTGTFMSTTGSLASSASDSVQEELGLELVNPAQIIKFRTKPAHNEYDSENNPANNISLMDEEDEPDEIRPRERRVVVVFPRYSYEEDHHHHHQSGYGYQQQPATNYGAAGKKKRLRGPFSSVLNWYYFGHLR